MSDYTHDFYTQYATYLVEPRVREVHDFALRALAGGPAFQGNVLDLGCGLREFNAYHEWHSGYVGVDELSQRADIRFNYRSRPELSCLVGGDFKPSAAVSLFSSEVTASACVNWTFYNHLFIDFPSLQSMLVSGFYYRDGRERMEKVQEAGGVESYQTIQPIECFINEQSKALIEETARLVLPCPSEMFGQYPVEVWRLLERKDV